jgi:hypothetical protein
MSDEQQPFHLRGMQDFYRVIRMLRVMHSEARHMALFAAEFWTDEELERSERAGDTPGNPGVLPTAGMRAAH